MLYLGIKAAHLIFVVAWMAAMMMYPRYKIHQLSAQPGEPLFDTMSAAAARLRRIIMTPTLVLVWVLGLTMLALNNGLLSSGWLWVKLLLVTAMSGLHGYFLGLGKKIDAGNSAVSARSLRMLNEVPFLLMIVVIVLAVTKAF